MKTITIVTRPRPKQSTRFSRHGAYQPKEIMEYTETIRTEARKQWDPPITDLPCQIMIMFLFPMPKSWTRSKQAEMHGKPHAQRPDVDNLIKPVLDALTGVVWKDDGQVMDLYVLKRWTSDTARIIMNIKEVKNDKD